MAVWCLHLVRCFFEVTFLDGMHLATGTGDDIRAAPCASRPRPYGRSRGA